MEREMKNVKEGSVWALVFFLNYPCCVASIYSNTYGWLSLTRYRKFINRLLQEVFVPLKLYGNIALWTMREESSTPNKINSTSNIENINIHYEWNRQLSEAPTFSPWSQNVFSIVVLFRLLDHYYPLSTQLWPFALYI